MWAAHAWERRIRQSVWHVQPQPPLTLPLGARFPAFGSMTNPYPLMLEDHMFKEFRDFAMRGNVVDMAIGIILGAAFGTIVKSLVSDVLMPPIGLLLGNVDFTNLFMVLKAGAENMGPYTTLDLAKEAGAVTINYGVWLNNVISFVIVAFVVFLLVKQMNKLKKQEEEKPAAPPEPSAQEKLLGEIRDLLKQRG